jgi:hypothetical protein
MLRIACGYIGSAAISTTLGWRWTFNIQAAGMVPFVALVLLVDAPAAAVPAARGVAMLDSDDDDDELLLLSGDAMRDVAPPADAKLSLAAMLHALLSNPVYVQIVVGYALFTAVIGSLGLFMPTYAANHLGITTLAASSGFGVSTALAGLLGFSCNSQCVDPKIYYFLSLATRNYCRWFHRR